MLKPLTRKPYRIDFALTTLTGNLTRYQTVKPLVEADPSVISRWYPLRTWFADDPLRVLPVSLRILLRHFLDARKLYFSRPPDAVVIHAFEQYYCYALIKKVMGLKTVLIKHPDGYIRPNRFSRMAVAQTELLLPWSSCNYKSIRELFPEVPDSRIDVLPPGINLDFWPLRPQRAQNRVFRALFVGGDTKRKGGDLLVEAFERHLKSGVELDIATQSAFLDEELRKRIERLPNVRLHLDLKPGTPEIKQLFAECDAFVLPTRDDMLPWVILEALATGIPVITHGLGGIPDMVKDGDTGLLLSENTPEEIAAKIETLAGCPELGEHLAEGGRHHVEEKFDARKNTQDLLCRAKVLIDQAQGRR